MPPYPNGPGNTLVPGTDGNGNLIYIEYDDDGTPLGEWYWDEDEGDYGEWVFEEYPPPLVEWPGSGLPRTGETGIPIGVYVATLILSLLAILSLSWKLKRRDWL